MRVGFGYDVHQTREGLPLFLGGVHIESPFGLVGHSDADVLIHAICDALLGAAGLRDIGYHFPDTDAHLKGIDSKILLRRVGELLAERGYRIGNIDATVAAQGPRLSPYIEEMRETLAEILNVGGSRVSIKATTTEHLGFEGRGEGIAAYAVALVEREEPPPVLPL